jgi:hypothetical protein
VGSTVKDVAWNPGGAMSKPRAQFDGVDASEVVEMYERCVGSVIEVCLESGVAQNIRRAPYGQVEEIS